MSALPPLFLCAALCATMFAANRAETAPSWRAPTYGLFCLVLLGTAAMALLAGLPLAVPLSPGAAGPGILSSTAPSAAVAAAAMLAGAACLAGPVRRGLGWLLPMYHPESTVHAVALALAVAYLAALVVAPLAGPATPVHGAGATALAQGAGLVAVALVGAGLGTRRTLGEALHRLGARAPARSGWLSGALVGLVVAALGVALAALGAGGLRAGLRAGNPGDLEALLVVPLFLVAGEEAVFRGGLRPRLGNLGPAVLYGVYHAAQPVSLAFLGFAAVGMILGRLWHRHGLTPCLLAHGLAVVVVAALAIAFQ